METSPVYIIKISMLRIVGKSIKPYDITQGAEVLGSSTRPLNVDGDIDDVDNDIIRCQRGPLTVL